MKNLASIFLPAVVAGVAAILTSGVASAENVNVFVVNNGGNTISEISNGMVSTFIATDLNSPTGMAINNAGDIFVANNGSNGDGYIEEYLPNGTDPTLFSSGENNPRGLTFDAAGNLDVAVQGSHEILQIPTGGGSGTVLASGFNAINDVAFNGGILYATDGGAGTIDTVSGGVGTPIVTHLSAPNGIAFDSNGNLLLVQHGNSTIADLNPSGFVVTQTSIQGPKTLAVDNEGDFFVTDNSDSTVTEYSYTATGATLVTTFSSPDFDGPCFDVVQLVVPEPTTYALMFAGLGLLIFMGRRKTATLSPCY